MECNKEEALRARDIAERKMQERDFLGACKFASKAQQLCPDLENISQMICVCDVHSSAEKKMFGNEKDWYGILQIEQTADDALIKKQYRKLALLLHPDKNKFPGAEAAFKLIGEAQRALLDVEKRRIYDVRRQASSRNMASIWSHSQTSRNFNAGKQSGAQGQSAVPNGRETFWTVCPYCGVRYQYYKEVLNKALRCQGCKKPFLACEMHGQGSTAANQPVFPQVPSQGTSKAPFSNAGFRGKSGVGRSQKTRPSHKNMNDEGLGKSRSSRIRHRKRGKGHSEESSESSESESSVDTDDVEIDLDGEIQGPHSYGGGGGERTTRRSVRNRRRVSYNEIEESSDEEIVNPSKRTKRSRSPQVTNLDDSETEELPNPSKASFSADASGEYSGKGGTNQANGNEPVTEANTKKTYEVVDDSSSDSEMEPEPMFHEYPDPDFSDFDKERKEECFQAGQVWAAYDTVDAMPRFYARIRKVFSPRFKLHITWFEPDPDNETEREWSKADLPFSCGKFKHGSSEDTEDRLMFSHRVSWEKGGGRHSIKIYPRKGETWALFKNWDMEWVSNPVNDRKFKYDFVEVLSEYDDTVGVCVARLGKLKGFASLFCRKDKDEILVPASEVLRFSHRVPSNRMTGEERDDVPSGSFELDPASITMDLEEVVIPKDTEKRARSNGSSSCSLDAIPVAKQAEEAASPCRDDQKGAQADHSGSLDGTVNDQASPSETCETPEPEFYNFDALKSLDKFQVGQVWALYSDLDGLPKDYGLVKRIDSHPDLKLHITRLEICYLPQNMICWKNKEMPISCGKFKIRSGKSRPYTTNSSFSHQLLTDPTLKKNAFLIYPQNGEVWALYKNWNPEMTPLDFEKWEYDIVEVLEEKLSHIEVLALERVSSYNSVFKPQMDGTSSVRMEISQTELLKFSHQIPSFRLTDEKGGSLRGFWELDPAALPRPLYKLK